MNSRAKKTGNGKNTKRYLKNKNKKIISQLVLILFKRKEKFKVETNVLGYIMKEVIFQK